VCPSNVPVLLGDLWVCTLNLIIYRLSISIYMCWVGGGDVYKGERGENKEKWRLSPTASSPWTRRATPYTHAKKFRNLLFFLVCFARLNFSRDLFKKFPFFTFYLLKKFLGSIFYFSQGL
jgi:hypothetical protein